jgi:uncharacterized repeat protein (TIGR01451 family)
MYLSSFNDNTIKNNIVSDNNICGISISGSNNEVYLNNFINNTLNAQSHGNNHWNSPQSITYMYNGSTYANKLGNYWDDYSGVDEDGDGIGDAVYAIGEYADCYPLIQLFDTYFQTTHSTEVIMNETSSSTHTLFESVISQNATLNTSVTGDFNGTLNFTDIEIVLINSGSFEGKGFSKGNWSANIEGSFYNGQWQGMLFKKPEERKIHLKGTVSGGLKGIVEGYLTESINGSGVYDHYQATWTICYIDTDIVFATLDLNGTANYQESSEYSSELYVLQTSIEGKASGHYNGSLSVVLTHVRIDNETNPCYGEGFSVISYVSDYGSGEGWTYDKLISPDVVELNGLFSNPLTGIVSGTLDESTSPRTLSLSIERIDLGLPPMVDLVIRKVWGLGTVSSGQTVDYIIEYRNYGSKAADDVVVVSQLPYHKTDYISSTAGGTYYAKEHQAFWELGTVGAGEGGILSVKVRYRWGLQSGEHFKIFSLIGTSSHSKHAKLPNIQKYLNYEPVRIVNAEVLPTSSVPEELAIELSDPNVENLYNHANKLGFNHTKTITRLTFSDDSKLTWILVMNGSDFNEPPLFITKFSNKAGTISFFMKFTDTSLIFFNETGGMAHDFLNSSYSGWGTWNISGSPSYWECIMNGVDAKAPGWILSESTHLLSGGWKTVAQIALAIPDCGGCIDDLFSGDVFTTDCSSCLSQGIRSIPAAGTITSAIGIFVDCIDTETYACVPGSTKGICARDRGLWFRLTDFPNKQYEMICTNNGVWEETGSYTICDASPSWGGPCSSGNGECIDGECICDPHTHESSIALPHDPNIKYGPNGFVLPIQKLNYTVEYENEGDGIAFGVYFTDTLDEDLDDSTLEIYPVFSTITGSVIAPPGIYDPGTRTITWFVGEVGPREGGYANLSADVRSDAEEGTEIINYATVYFPSVPEETRTNGIVSIVDTASPKYSNVGQSKSEVTVGEVVKVHTYWQDGVQLNHTWLETNESGTWGNVSYLKLWNDGWSNYTIQTTQEGVVCWSVHANDTAENENVTPMLCFDVLPASKTHTISLSPGWNLISIPLNLTIRELGEEAAVGDPLNVTPENSLTSIYRYNTTSESFEKCTHYTGWGWAPATGSESFTELEPVRGYWVMAENDCDMTFTGTAPSDLDVPLDADWNCIGWYSTSEALLGEEAAVGDPLNVTLENSMTSIYRYNNTSELFEKCTHYADWGWAPATGSESFIELEPGRGYWVMAENDCLWRHEV